MASHSSIIIASNLSSNRHPNCGQTWHTRAGADNLPSSHNSQINLASCISCLHHVSDHFSQSARCVTTVCYTLAEFLQVLSSHLTQDVCILLSNEMSHGIYQLVFSFTYQHAFAGISAYLAVNIRTSLRCLPYNCKDTTLK